MYRRNIGPSCTRSAVDLKRYFDISEVYRSWLHSLGAWILKGFQHYSGPSRSVRTPWDVYFLKSMIISLPMVSIGGLLDWLMPRLRGFYPSSPGDPKIFSECYWKLCSLSGKFSNACPGSRRGKAVQCGQCQLRALCAAQSLPDSQLQNQRHEKAPVSSCLDSFLQTFIQNRSLGAFRPLDFVNQTKKMFILANSLFRDRR